MNPAAAVMRPGREYTAGDIATLAKLSPDDARRALQALVREGKAKATKLNGREIGYKVVTCR
jgi:Fic family protein